MRVLLLLLIAGVAFSQHHLNQPIFFGGPIGHHAPIIYPPRPYAFGYGFNNGKGTDQHHEQSGDEHGNKKGSYGYRDAHGIYRQVDYVADKHGFRAVVKTNEPGTASQDPAHVNMVANPVMVIRHHLGHGYGLGPHNLHGVAPLGHAPAAIGVGHGLHPGFGGYGAVGSPFVHYAH